MDCDRIVFSGHAVQRMFERGIEAKDVERVLRHGEVVEEYPDDTPFPSCLMLKFVEGRPIHVVVAFESETRTCHVMTAYPPDPDLWDAGFKQRKSS
ncbi:MAG: DUF4258 domain-containing protein [Alphaproteobacteria bacterium]